MMIVTSDVKKGKHLTELKMQWKMLLTWPDQVDKNFQGRTNIISTIAENFYHRIKIFKRIFS